MADRFATEEVQHGSPLCGWHSLCDVLDVITPSVRKSLHHSSHVLWRCCEGGGVRLGGGGSKLRKIAGKSRYRKQPSWTKLSLIALPGYAHEYGMDSKGHQQARAMGNSGNMREIAINCRKLQNPCGKLRYMAENCGNCEKKFPKIAETAKNCGPQPPLLYATRNSEQQAGTPDPAIHPPQRRTIGEVRCGVVSPP